MTYLALVPLAIALGVAGLAAFLWSLRDGQYDDLAGAAERIFLDASDRPIGEAHSRDAAVGGAPPGESEISSNLPRRVDLNHSAAAGKIA